MDMNVVSYVKARTQIGGFCKRVLRSIYVPKRDENAMGGTCSMHG
jgi:hypothetical protein